jgi:hypothetical protein
LNRWTIYPYRCARSTNIVAASEFLIPHGNWIHGPGGQDQSSPDGVTSFRTTYWATVMMNCAAVFGF